jgi:hypothetical protein
MIWWLLVCDEAEPGGEGREITQQITRAGSKSRESRVKSRESGANKKQIGANSRRGNRTNQGKSRLNWRDPEWLFT